MAVRKARCPALQEWSVKFSYDTFTTESGTLFLQSTDHVHFSDFDPAAFVYIYIERA